MSSGGGLQDWVKQSNNPAAPAGAQQAAEDGRSRGGDTLGAWVDASNSKQPYVDNAKSWYTGAQYGSVENGWDNRFMKEAYKQYEDTVEKFKDDPDAFENWLKDGNATGVVTWGEHRTEGDLSTDAKFGDIYKGGRRVGNLYNDYKKPDADLMITPWMLDAKTQAKVFADPNGDSVDWLGEEVEAKRSEMTDMLSRGVEARKFEGKVNEKQREIDDEGWGHALAGGAAVLGAGIAGAAISVATGGAATPAAIAGTAAVGGAFFGGAAELNRDQITNLAASAIVQQNLADEKFGDFQGYSAATAGWSQVGMKLISPLSNTVQGIGDISTGGGLKAIGDEKEGFSEIDENGNRKVGAWIQAADVAGVLGDSLLQFTNPVGLAAYSGAMVGTIAGNIGVLGTTGESFSYRDGGYRDHEGWKENTAAWLNIGIDAVQLGMVRGLTAAGKTAAASVVGQEGAAKVAGRFADNAVVQGYKGTKAGIQGKLPMWAGGLREGQTAETIAGSRYVTEINKATGKREAVYRGWSLSSLAPSELVQRTATSLRTRVKGLSERETQIAAEAGARREIGLMADDYYRSAVILASGKTSRFGSALLNGFGEGAEEFAQGMLEPISNDSPINWQEVARAFVYGAAAGVGMGLGTSINGPSQTQKLYGRFLAKGLFTNEEMTLEQFEALPPDRQKGLAQMSEADVAKNKKVRQQVEKSLGMGVMDMGAWGRHVLTDGAKSEFERAASKINPALSSVLKVIGLHNPDVTNDRGELQPGSAGTHNAEVSAFTAIRQLDKNVAALGIHVQSLTEDIKTFTEQQADPELSPERQSEIAGQLAQAQEMLLDAQAGIEMGTDLAELMKNEFHWLDQHLSKGDEKNAFVVIDRMNAALEQAYFGQMNVDGAAPNDLQSRGQKLAAGLLIGRDPLIARGSYIILGLRISKAYTRDKSDGVVAIHQSLLAAPNADFDGDNLRMLRNIILSRQVREQLTSGEQYLEDHEEPAVVPFAAGSTSVTVKIGQPDGEEAMLRNVRDAVRESRTRSTATKEIDSLVEILWLRYKDIVRDPVKVHAILEELRQNVTEGNTASRQIFLDALATEARFEIQEQARKNGYAEWTWVSQLITSKLDAIQKAYSRTQPEYDYDQATHTTVADTPSAAFTREIFVGEAASMGETLLTLRSGTNPQRGAQALHYTTYNALVEMVESKAEVPAPLMDDFIEFFEGRSSGDVRSSLDDMLAKDSTVRRVFTDLQRILSEGGLEFGEHTPYAMLLLGMTEVQDVEFTAEGVRRAEHSRITLIQLLLKRSIRIDRITYAEQAERNVDVENRLNNLEYLTSPHNEQGGHSTAAQEAMYEVFADIPMFQLIGESSMYFGAQQTMRSLRHSLLDMDRETREDAVNVWKRKAAYLDRSQRTNPPYSAIEVGSGAIHPYRIAVDALFAVANKAAPNRQKQADTARGAFIEGWGQLHTARLAYANFLTGNDRARFEALSPSLQMLEMINSSSRLQTIVGDLIPQAVISGSFSVDENGKVFAANWITEMFGMQSKEALMHYYRNTVLADYLVAGRPQSQQEADIADQVASDVDDAKKGHEHARVWAKLKTQSARQLYQIAAQQDGVLLAEYLRKLGDATDLDKFEAEVLNNPMYNRGPRIVVFAEDVAEIDESFETTWQSQYPGAIQREAMQALQNGARQYSADLGHAVAVMKSDKKIAGDIEAYILSTMGRGNSVADTAELHAGQLAKVIQNRQEIWQSIGPTARDQAAAVVQNALYILQNKGAADPAFATHGASRVLAEGGGTEDALSRGMSDVTAFSEEEILNNPSLFASRAMRIQLDNGAELEWLLPDYTDLPNPEEAHDVRRQRFDLLQYARLLKDPATAGFIKQVLGLTHKDVTANGKPQTVRFSTKSSDKYLSHSLLEMLSQSDLSHMFAKRGERLTPAEAHEYITNVEGGVFKQVYGADAETQTNGFYPLQQMIHEILTAYTHALPDPLKTSAKAEEMRNYVYVTVAETVQLLADQEQQDSTRIPLIKERIAEELKERFGTPATGDILEGARTADERVLMLVETSKMRLEALVEANRQLTLELEQATTPQEFEANRVKQKAIADEAKLLTDSVKNTLTSSSADAVLQMFTITAADPATAAIQKKAILNYLSTSGRIGYFTDSDAEVWRVVRSGLSSQAFKDTGNVSIPDELWPTISRAAATVYLSERARLTGTSVSLKLLEATGGGWKDVARYFDHTWAYLIELALTEPVMKSAQFIAGQSAWKSGMSWEDAADQILRTVYNKDRIGHWHATTVQLQLAHKQTLKSSGVDLAVAIIGDSPSKMVTTIQGTAYSYDVPTAPPTTRALSIDELNSSDAQLVLEGRFVQRNGGARFLYTKTDGTQGEYDLFTDPKLAADWGDPNDPDQSKVFNSGFTTVTYERLRSAVMRAQENVADIDRNAPVSVELIYFDPEQRPAGPEWAHNIFYSGPGRSGPLGSRHSAIAGTVMGNNGIYAEGVQLPLDAIKKDLSAFTPTPHIDLALVKQLEQSGATIYQVLKSKASLLLSREYDFGKLQTADFNGLMEWLRVRHVVVGIDADGLPAVWTVDRANASQQPGATEAPLQNMKLVPLSKKIADKMLGDTTGRTDTPVAMSIDQAKVSNIQEWTHASLAKQGIDSLGARADIRKTGLLYQTPLVTVGTPITTTTPPIGLYRPRMTKWRAEQAAAMDSRSKQFGKNGKYNRKKMQKTFKNATDDALSLEAVAIMMRHAGPAAFGLPVDSDMDLVKHIKSQMDDRMEGASNNTFWVHRFGLDVSPDPTQGILTTDNYLSVDMGPVFGDNVAIDLAEAEGLGQSDRKTFTLVKAVIDEYMSRGLTIHFINASGATSLRSDLRNYALNSGKGYDRLSMTSITPSLSDTEWSQSARALSRTLIETRVVSRDALRWEFRSDRFFQANENSSHFNQRDDNGMWYLMRSNILGARPVGYANPQTDEQRTMIRTKLLPLLRTEAGLDHFAKMAGGDKDPEVRGQLEKLRDTLAAGEMPLTEGKTFGFGYFDVLVGPGDTIYLGRQGFEKSLDSKVAQMAATAVGQTEPIPGVPGTGIAVSSPKRDEALTSNVGIIEHIEPSPMGGKIRVTYRVPGSVIGAKGLSDKDGMKHGVMPMPDNLAFPRKYLANNQAISLGSGQVAGASKEALFAVVKNFRSGFLALGADFREDMIEYIFGSRPVDRKDFEKKWTEAEALLKAIANADFNVSADDVAARFRSESNRENGNPLVLAHLTTQLGMKNEGLEWLTKERDETSVNDRLGELIISTLMIPEVKLEHIIMTPGVADIANLGDNERALLMPQVFTDALDDYRFPKLRETMFDRFNSRWPQRTTPDSDGTLGYDYRLYPNWDFVVRMEENGVEDYYIGELKLTNFQLDDKHPELQEQSENATVHNGVSMHGAAQAAVLYDAGLAYRKDFNEVAKYFDGSNLPDFQDASLWTLLQNLPDEDMPAIARSYSEALWASTAKRRHNLNRKPIDATKYSDGGVRYRGLAARISQTMFAGDDAYIGEVDYLVRIMSGKRGIDKDNPSEEDGVDLVEEDVALGYLTLIQQNLDAGRFPTHGSPTGPLIDATLLQMMFDANKQAASPWRPLASEGGRNRVYAKMDLGSWAAAAFGQMQASNDMFDPAFQLDLDGAWLTYESMRKELADLPPSTSPFVSMKLLNPETQELALSMNPLMAPVLSSVIGMSGSVMTLEAFLMGQALPGAGTAESTSASAVSKRLADLKAWHAKNDTAIEGGSIRDYVKQGAWYLQRSKGTHRIFQDLTNLRIGMALFNPALMIAAVPEVTLRRALDASVAMLTGTATGNVGQWVGKFGQAAGWEPRYDKETSEKIERLISKLGDDPRFMGMLYDELQFSHMIEPGRGKVSRGLEQFARWGGRLQDPNYGMFGGTVARRYIESALAYLEFDPSNVISIDRFISEMNNNPKWLEENSPKGTRLNSAAGLSAHSSGLNAVAQIRALRQNLVGKAVRGIYDPMTESGSWSVNFAGHLIKWPLLFSNYTAGAAMFLTGTTGINDFVAASLHGREKVGTSALQRAMRGQPYVPGEVKTYDMSDVLEGMDLTRSFLRAGVTWSGYIAYMLMGGVGLSGEDEEAKRRRLLAQYYGVPLQYDPTDPVNDWRNADMVYLNALPGPLSSIATLFQRDDGEGGKTSVMMPHWIIRQFVSPLLGIERFMSTGDIRQIKWGFQDAISVLPNSVTRTWHDATQMADELSKLAADSAAEGDPESMSKTNRFLINIVGTYERAFLESSFINTIRNGADQYDRDPWVQVKTDKNGNIVRDNMDNPEQTDALVSYVNDNGEVKKAYAGHSWWSAQMHQYAENNTTFSLLASIISGKFTESDYLRKNMAVKEKNIALKGLKEDEAKGMFLKAFDKAGGTELLTVQEAAGQLRSQYKSAGMFRSPAEITEEALSIVRSVDGREVLTKEGSRAVFESIYAGSVDLNSPSLSGIFVSQEMRKEIQDEIVSDLVQEGMDSGMDEVSAKYRANRIWYGHSADNPDQIGIRDIVWSNDIENQPTATYNQLNTTFVMGPGGTPYATGIRRDSWFEALGLNPLGTGVILNHERGMGTDARFNSTDTILNLNTGLRALERNESKSLKPDDEALKKTLDKTFAKSTDTGNYKGYSGYKRRAFARRGYGGGGYSSSSRGFPNFSRMFTFEEGGTPFGVSIPFINTSNPILRRADIRRERVWSERGRLKQWQ